MIDGLARAEIAQLRALVALVGSIPAPTATGEQVVGVPFSFSTPSPLVLGPIKAGQILNRAVVLITTGFNGATPKISFGTTTNPNAFMGSPDFSPKTADQYEANDLKIATSNDILLLTIVPDGSSQGAGVVFFKLYPP